MCREKWKLQLTCNVIGSDDSNLRENGTKDPSSNNLRSMIIYGLHKFDPSEDVEKVSNETSYTEMKCMAEKVLGTRLHGFTSMADERFKIDSRERTRVDSIYFYDGNDVSSDTYIETDSHHDKNADEVAFKSWMDRAKDVPLND